LLIEESRTNLVTYSQDFTNAAWTGGTLTNMTLGTAVGNSPDGTVNAGVLTATDASCSYQSANSIATTIVGTQTMSIYVKSTNRQWWRIRVYRTSTNAATCWFDLQNGVVGNNASVGSLTFSSATIFNAGNGWWRISMVVTSSAAGTNASFWAAPATSNGGTSGGAIGDALNIWGHQYETGAFATSYIPTVASQVTRNADVATMTGTNFSDWFNASEGTFTFQGVNYDISTTKVILDATDGTLNERIQLSTATNKYFMADGGSTQANFGTGTITANVAYKMVAAYKLNDLAFALNGAATQTDNTATLPTLNQMTIGTRAVFVNINQYSGWLQKLNYYPQRLINAEVQAFSK